MDPEKPKDVAASDGNDDSTIDQRHEEGMRMRKACYDERKAAATRQKFAEADRR